MVSYKRLSAEVLPAQVALTMTTAFSLSLSLSCPRPVFLSGLE